ncbi:hypothetical protein WR25_00743 [Diploscapter pachys]|uniref:SelT-like protein n=1 Tax=Diploscapter pachys TaxID=2018661 RepID=A0A2A2LET5_9BILA|nr:hypothetical protein WR25_00743 [Diploscapter pachys]
MNKFGYYILSFALILSIRDVFVRVPAHVEDEHDADEFKKEFGDEIPADEGYSKGTEEDHIELREPSSFSKPKSLTGIKDLPTMKFDFCVSCGYRNAFEQFSHMIRERYPDMPIEGSNYPPAPWKAFLAQAINVLKMVAIGIVVSGANPFEALGLGYPSILQYGHQNKLVDSQLELLGKIPAGSGTGFGDFQTPTP